MFYNCSSLEELNISNFDINNAIDIPNIFDGCLPELITKIISQNTNIKD